MIGHVGVFPVFGPVGQPDALLEFCAKAFRTIVWGPPAVIAFFIISGFCIHYPFAESKRKSPILLFYVRRYLRILVPVICTVALFKVLFPGTTIFGSNTILWNSTLWSIVCEEIYYAAYPILNRWVPLVGWSKFIGITFLISIVMSWAFSAGPDWQDMGFIATAVTLFPVWLMGCLLAENVKSHCSRKSISVGQVWLWRLVAWAVMWIAMILHFHFGFYQTASGLWVGLVYYFWLRAEISYYASKSPWELLVRGGQWSYSLYLVHPIIVRFCQDHSVNGNQSRLDWVVVVVFVLSAAYIFYLLVEWPSHKLARRVPLFSAGEAIPPSAATKIKNNAMA